MVSATDPEAAAELLGRAFQAQMSGDLATAIDLYQRSIAACPTAEAHTFLGWTYSFQGRLEAMRDARVGRARAMVEKLAALGKPVAWERVLALAGEGAIGRPHVAKALVDAGHVTSVRDAFDRYIGRNGPAYAELAKQFS